MTEPKFSCQEQLVPGETYDEKFAFLAQAGYSGIEIWSQNLSAQTDQLSELCKSTGIRVSSGCQGFDGGLINVDEQGRSKAISATMEALHALAALKAGGFVVPAGFALGSKVLPPFKPPRPAIEDHAALCDSLAQILPLAADLQVTIFLEPINRYEIHYLNTLSEAIEIVSTINHPYLKLMADFFHMNIEEAAPDMELERAAGSLAHVHLADSNRKLPGQGHLDFVRHFQALQRTGYQGWLVIECDDSPDPTNELPAALQYLRDCWLMAGKEA